MPSASGPKCSRSPLPSRTDTLRAPAPTPQHQGLSSELVVVEADHATVPAAVMTWTAAKLVGRCRRGRRSAAPQSARPSASQESSTTRRPWRSAISRIRSQSGTLPSRLGARIALVLRADHLLDGVGIDLEGVRRDVNECGNDPRLHHRGDVGGERHRRRDDLVAGLQAEHVDRQPQGRRSRVDHHTVALRKQRGHCGLELGNLRTDGEVRRAQHLDHGVDLALVVHSARIGQAFRRVGHQRPFQIGGRFSANAFGPSLASSLRNTAVECADSCWKALRNAFTACSASAIARRASDAAVVGL